jgi:thiol-disulfide isomerase/thioredoxin
MKKSNIYSLVVLCAGLICSNTLSAQTIKGKIKGINAGKIYLKSMSMRGNEKLLDSADIVKGSFAFQNKIAASDYLQLQIQPGNWSAAVFVDPGKMTIALDTLDATHYDYTMYGSGKGAMINTVTATGSANQDIYSRYQNHPNSVNSKAFYVAANKRYEKETDKEKKEAIRAEMSAYGENHKKWEKKYLDSLVANHSSMVATAYLLNYYKMFNRNMPVEDLNNMYQKLTGDAKESIYAKEIKKDLDIKLSLEPGKLAPEFKALRPDSTEFTLSSTRGKYVMLDFWASWCVPCRQAIPHWKEVYEKYKNKGFEIVAVTNDNKWSNWFKALEDEKMPWIQVADDFPIERSPARIATQYNIPSLPTYVLLDKEGKLIIHTTDKSKIDAKLAEIFN